MRIALCGASGTGKTTLANELAIAFNLPLEQYEHPDGSGRMTSLSRALAYEYTGIDEPYSVDERDMRREFQIEGLKRKRNWELEHHAGFVSDRTHLDWLAYTVLHGIDLAVDDQFYRACFEYSRGYDCIVLCTMARLFNVGNDPARKKSIIYQGIYEDILKSFLVRLVSGWFSSPRLVVPAPGEDIEIIIKKVQGVL